MKKLLIGIFSLATILSYSHKITLSPTFNVNYDKSFFDLEVKERDNTHEEQIKKGISAYKKREEVAKRMSFGVGIDLKYDLSEALKLSEKFKLGTGISILGMFDYKNVKSKEIQTSEHEPASFDKKIYFNALLEGAYNINEDLSIFSKVELGPGLHLYNAPEYQPTEHEFKTSIESKKVFSFNTQLTTGINYRNFKVGALIGGNFTNFNEDYNKIEAQKQGNYKVKSNLLKIGGFISYDIPFNF